MNIPPLLNPPPPGTPSPMPGPASANPPKRHGCLVTWMILMILLETLSLLTENSSSTVSSSPILGALGGTAPAPPWYSPAIQLLALTDIVCVIFIFRWKKWAFFGSAGAAVAVFLLGVIAHRPTLDGLSAILLPAVLYGVLQIGGANSGWKRLK